MKKKRKKKAVEREIPLPSIHFGKESGIDKDIFLIILFKTKLGIKNSMSGFCRERYLKKNGK